MAFEVLEHIEDDEATLAEWVSYLKLGGRLILSVPAHPSRWNESDVWAGHYRRYSANGLIGMAESNELVIDHWEYYGFPLTNITDPIRSFVHARQLRRNGRNDRSVDKMKNSLRSGIERPLETRLFPIIDSLAGRIALRTFFLLQQLAHRLPAGNGILVVARRPM